MAHRKPQIGRRLRDFEAELKPAVLDEPAGRWDCLEHENCRDKRDHRGRGSFVKHTVPRSSTCSPDPHRGEISTDCFRGRERRGRGRNVGGNRRGRGGRFNNRGAGSKEDLLKAFEGLKFVQASAESEGIDENYLETIDVYLTEKELAMPPASQELRTLLKRCSYVKRFDIVPKNVARNVLEATRSEVDTFKLGLETSVTLIRESIVPPVFFLQSNQHKDRLNFINLMLTDTIRSSEQRSRTDTISFEGNDSVAVEPSILKGVFVRGVVSEVVSAKECKVYLVDYGVTETVECCRIRSLPAFLCDEPSVGNYAFFHNLHELEEPELSGVFERWEILLKEVNEFDCRVVSSSKQDGAEYFGVELFYYVGDEIIDVEKTLTKNETEEICQDDLRNSNTSKSPSTLFCEGYLNADVEIQEYMELDYRYVKQVVALFVKSPDEIILLHVTGDGKVPDWFIEMQRYYQDENLSLLCLTETDRVLVNRSYAWYDTICKTWNRGKVTKVMDTKAELWAMDRGEFVVVDMKKMRELNPNFRLSSALSFRAHLAHVAPFDNDIGWSKDAAETVKMAFGLDSDGARRNVKSQKKDNFTKGQLLDALVVEVKELNTEKVNGYMVSLGIVLAEQVPPNSGTIQAKLVESKLAYPTGPCSGRHDLSYLISGEPYYNRDHLLQYLTSKTGCRAAGLNSKLPLKEILATFKESKKLTKAYCPAIVIRRDWRKYGRSNTEDVPHPEWTKSGKHVPATMQKRMGYVNITYEGTGPGQFFIQTQDKWIEFGKMMEDLQGIVEEMPQPVQSDIRPGMLALATALNKEEFNAWGRVVVVSVNLLANLFDVLFIDFGFIYETSLSRIRYLPPYFDTIPSFCQRVHLDFYTKETPVVPVGYMWSSRAKSLWKKQIVQWSDYSPIYYAWTVRPGVKEAFVYLEEFDQELHYDRDHRWWYGSESGEGSDYPTLTAMKDHPLVKPFFTSIGVNIAYEKEADGSKLEFVPIWKTLKDAELVVSE